jgi:hypothetical protein
LPGHAVHEVEPADDEKVPAGHSEQTPPVQALPAGQLLHAVQAAEVVKPVAEKKPEEHAHWVDPVEVATLLPGHDVHELEPAVAVNVLAAHTVQRPAEQDEPAAQELHAVQARLVVKPVAEKKPVLHTHSLAPAAALLLPGHAEHAVEPAAVEKVLVPQVLHRPEAHAEPAAHELHAVQAAPVVKPVAEKKPDEHVHWVAPPLLLLPAGHEPHDALADVVEKVPAEHWVQVPPVQRLPAAHDEQAVHAAEVVKPEAEKKPVLHAHWVAPEPDALLPGQAEHAAEPTDDEKVPAPHTEQRPPAHQLPDGQLLHAVQGAVVARPFAL